MITVILSKFRQLTGNPTVCECIGSFEKTRDQLAKACARNDAQIDKALDRRAAAEEVIEAEDALITALIDDSDRAQRIRQKLQMIIE